ncbi:alpha/beta hydrolase [Terasakiispira papahanaumokuakeensis]|uniref:alpha/beta hydrolase n=1 Tax=Terasakiispira papahanaumokuakeensis TaxID=197479 RepID=UPI001FE11A70|nr:alpha/beta hydrolase-fold protein [Terasakiispira papahanaumokuakeensis]
MMNLGISFPMRWWLGLVILLWGGWVQASPAADAHVTDQDTTEAFQDEGPVRLDKTREWSMHNARGERYRIFISEPEGPLPYTGGYPVLYVLDGNAFFASLHEAKRAQERFQQAIIVGIAYPGEATHNFRRRAYDFSPPPGEPTDPPQGGQDEFLDFMAQQVMPAVARQFPVNHDQETLYGHSFGGMLGLYALYTRPGLFDHIIAASPSLWWADRYLLPHERAFSQAVKSGRVDGVNQSLSLMVGDQDSLQEQQDAEQLSQRLSGLSAYGLRSSFYRVDGADHMAVPFNIENRILRQVLETRNE